MSRLETKFLNKLGDQWQGATPGFCVQAYHRGKKIVDIEVGETFEIYDWASVTKIVFTTTALMFRHDEKVLSLNDKVERWVSWFPENSWQRVRDLLNHSAGMTWWKPYYKDLIKKVGPTTSPEDAWEIFQQLLRKSVIKDFKKSGAVRPEKSVYSDLDFFLLGVTLESVSGTTLYTVWDEVRERTGLKNTDFLRGNKPKGARSRYAPTEDCAWRKKVLQGEVHDQNTWALRGVAPHAGLFGPIDDLSQWGLLLRDGMRGKKSKRFASPETVKLFTRRSLPRKKGDWALGFSMPSKEGASAGPLFSMDSVGHLGFSGTSLWYDPKRDLLVTILSNRIHPSVENAGIRTLRPLIHTLIAEQL